MTENHPQQHDACPEHHHRCHATFHGTIDCPNEHIHFKTTMLTVACGTDDPKPQIVNFLAQPAHALAEVVQVLDLNHNGWLVIFREPV